MLFLIFITANVAANENSLCLKVPSKKRNTVFGKKFAHQFRPQFRPI